MGLMYDSSFGASVRLARFDANGDTLWTNKLSIDYTQDVRWFGLYLKDLHPTPDGGYVLAGYQYSPSPQKSWIIKVDSLGNTCQQNCDSTILINSLQPAPFNTAQTFSTFNLSPNPATTQATLYITQPAAHRQLRIYNMSGQQVKNLSLPDYISEYRFSVADLSAGIYLCKVGNDLGQKLVIIK